MISNPKLNIKVLKQIAEDFVHVEASLVNVQDEETQKRLFLETREYRKSIQALINYYKRILERQAP